MESEQEHGRAVVKRAEKGTEERKPTENFGLVLWNASREEIRRAAVHVRIS